MTSRGDCGTFSPLMANTKSAAKRARVAERRRTVNKANRSNVKTAARNIRRLVEEGKKDEAQKLLPELQRKADKAAKKGAIHANKASRTKARIAKLVA